MIWSVDIQTVLNAARARHKEEIAKARKAVLTVEGIAVGVDLDAGEMSFDDFIEAADFAVIEDAFRRAGPVLSPDLATTYCEAVAKSKGDPADLEAALIEARVTIAAIGMVPGAETCLEDEAEKRANDWLTRVRVEIRGLSDERQEICRQLREMSADPLDVDLAGPKSWMQPTTIREADGTETPLRRYDRHLMCTTDGLFPEDFDSWEADVIAAELKRPDVVGWYRTPSRASQDSLGVTYENDGETKIVRPDFIIFARLPDGQLRRRLSILTERSSAMPFPS